MPLFCTNLVPSRREAWATKSDNGLYGVDRSQSGREDGTIRSKGERRRYWPSPPKQGLWKRLCRLYVEGSHTQHALTPRIKMAPAGQPQCASRLPETRLSYSASLRSKAVPDYNSISLENVPTVYNTSFLQQIHWH